jgi:hypothetical protein
MPSFLDDKGNFLFDLAYKKLDQTIVRIHSYDTKTSIILAAYGVLLASIPKVIDKLQWNHFTIIFTIGVCLSLFIGLICALMILMNSNPQGLPDLHKIDEIKNDPQRLLESTWSDIIDSSRSNMVRLVGHETLFRYSSVLLSLAFTGILILLAIGGCYGRQ